MAIRQTKSCGKYIKHDSYLRFKIFFTAALAVLFPTLGSTIILYF